MCRGVVWCAVPCALQLAMNEELRRWFMPKYGIGSSYDMKVELGQPGHEIVYGGAKDGAEAKTTRGGVFVAEVLESGKHYHALHKQVRTLHPCNLAHIPCPVQPCNPSHIPCAFQGVPFRLRFV